MNKKLTNILLFILFFLILWFSDVIPKQIVKIVAGNYISAQENGEDYRLNFVEYSPAHDCYFAYYQEKSDPDGKTRNIGIYYRWFPFHVYFDSKYPG